MDQLLVVLNLIIFLAPSQKNSKNQMRKRQENDNLSSDPGKQNQQNQGDGMKQQGNTMRPGLEQDHQIRNEEENLLRNNNQDDDYLLNCPQCQKVFKRSKIYSHLSKHYKKPRKKISRIKSDNFWAWKHYSGKPNKYLKKKTSEENEGKEKRPYIKRISKKKGSCQLRRLGPVSTPASGLQVANYHLKRRRYNNYCYPKDDIYIRRGSIPKKSSQNQDIKIQQDKIIQQQLDEEYSQQQEYRPSNVEKVPDQKISSKQADDQVVELLNYKKNGKQNLQYNLLRQDKTPNSQKSIDKNQDMERQSQDQDQIKETKYELKRKINRNQKFKTALQNRVAQQNKIIKQQQTQIQNLKQLVQKMVAFNKRRAQKQANRSDQIKNTSDKCTPNREIKINEVVKKEEKHEAKTKHEKSEGNKINQQAAPKKQRQTTLFSGFTSFTPQIFPRISINSNNYLIPLNKKQARNQVLESKNADTTHKKSQKREHEQAQNGKGQGSGYICSNFKAQ